MQARLIAGDSLNFATTALGYPASEGWSLHFELRSRDTDGQQINLDTVAEGDDHRLRVIAAETDQWPPGPYSWRSIVTKGAERYTVETGTTEVVANPSTATKLDLRSGAQKALDDLKAFMQGKVAGGVYEYRIGERGARYYTWAELVMELKRLTAEVNREKRADLIAAGMSDPRRFQVRMGRA